MAEPAVKMAQAPESLEGKYLTFSLNGEDYGVHILKVREIIGVLPITSVPQTPEFLKGVINLRGKVVPVVDLRLRFGMTPQEYTDRTCIIVTEVANADGSLMMGVGVDSVSEVAHFKADQIEDTPSFGTALNTDYILGMAKNEAKVSILLDIDKVLTAEEANLLRA